VEDDIGLCGYALAVLDAKSYFAKLEVSWIPELLKKYPLHQGEQEAEHSKHLNLFLDELHNDYKRFCSDPDVIFKNHPSFLNLTVMSSIMDLSVPKRMLACVIAALKANGMFCFILSFFQNDCFLFALGSKGVYCRISSGDKKSLDFHIKLGFQIIPIPNATEKDDLYVGRTI